MSQDTRGGAGLTVLEESGGFRTLLGSRFIPSCPRESDQPRLSRRGGLPPESPGTLGACARVSWDNLGKCILSSTVGNCWIPESPAHSGLCPTVLARSAS